MIYIVFYTTGEGFDRATYNLTAVRSKRKASEIASALERWANGSDISRSHPEAAQLISSIAIVDSVVAFGVEPIAYIE